MKHNSFLLILLSCTLISAFSIQVHAEGYKRIPMFSASLFDGDELIRNKRRNGTTISHADYQKATRPVARRRTTLRFAEGVTNLNDDQKKRLTPFVQRVQNDQISEIQVSAFSRTYYHSYLRILALQRYFSAYCPGLRVRGRNVSGESVMDANNNTVDIVEIK